MAPLECSTLMSVAPSRSGFPTVELRGFEPRTFSLRRLLLHDRLESGSVRRVARDASELIVAVVGGTQGHHGLPLP
jgi:hypothetical protein